MSAGGLGIIIQRIRSQVEILVTKTNIIIEHRHLGIRMIFAPVTRQRRTSVHQLTTLKEITEVIQSVIIQAVCIQRRLTMFQNDIITCLGYLGIAVIIGIVAEEFQGVTLQHLHMSECFKGVCLLEEISTITVKVGTHVAEMHITCQYLGIPIPILVVSQLVRMNQIDTFVFRPLARGVALAGRLHRPDETQPEKAQQHECYSPESHLIQP